MIAQFGLLQCAMAQRLKPASLFQGGVKFSVPASYHVMSQSEITRKFPTARPPKYAWANDKRATSTIAVTHAAAKLPPSRLGEFKTFMEKMLSQSQRGIKWIKREIIVINGTRWVHFEFTSQAIDTRIHNDMLFTSFRNEMLGFNFNSTVAQWKKVQPQLKRCRASIVLKR
ncbi:MAG: hypothetical protein JWN98_671 [Abditibacteriota bacterium]|nr:hypothetical protein [Abditibacteriota bacterium]